VDRLACRKAVHEWYADTYFRPCFFLRERNLALEDMDVLRRGGGGYSELVDCRLLGLQAIHAEVDVAQNVGPEFQGGTPLRVSQQGRQQPLG